MRKTIIFLVAFLMGNLLSAQDLATHQKQGEALMNEGDMAGALAEFNKAIDLDDSTTGNGMIYSYAGICAQQIGDMESAKSFFQQSIDRGFKDEKVFELLGSILSKEKDYPAQIALYTKALELFPEQSLHYNKKICNAYYYSKQYDKVETLAADLLVKDPKDTKVRQQCANSLMRLKKTKEAVAAYEELLTYDPDNSTANKYLGNYYYQVGKSQIDRQTKKYEAIEKPDRVQWTDNNKKITALVDKYYSKAIPYLQKAYAQKEEASIKKMLFVIYTKMGNKEEAAKYE